MEKVIFRPASHVEEQEPAEKPTTLLAGKLSEEAKLYMVPKSATETQLFESLIISCLNDPPYASPGFPHESMPAGNTYFQNCIIPENIDPSRLPYFNKHIEIYCKHREAFKYTSDRIVADRARMEQELEEFCNNKENRKAFARFRYFPCQEVLGENGKETVKTTDSEPGATIEEQPAPAKQGTEWPQVMKMVAYFIHTVNAHCGKIAKKQSHFEASTTGAQDKPFGPTLCPIIDRWDKLVLASLELQTHLGFLTDIINKVAQKVLPHYTDDPNVRPRFPAKPQMTLWRLCVELFRGTVYTPLYHDLYSIASERLFALRENELRWKSNQIPEPQGQTKQAPPPGVLRPRFGNLRELRNLERYFQFLVDMTVNELTVHYIKCTQIAPKKLLAHLNESLKLDTHMGQTRPLHTIFSTLSTEHQLQLLLHDVTVCKLVLPPAVARLWQSTIADEIESYLEASKIPGPPHPYLSKIKQKCHKYMGNIQNIRDAEILIQCERLQIPDVTKAEPNPYEAAYLLPLQPKSPAEEAMDLFNS